MLSTRRVRVSDRPPKVESGGWHASTSNQGWWWSAALRGLAAFTLCALISASAWAAGDPRPRTDPGEPPAVPGGIDEGWFYQTIPDLPAKAILGDVWVSNTGIVYVWADFPTSARLPMTDFEEGNEGERLPGGGTASQPRSSIVYRYDGLSWTAVLSTPGETGVALYGTDDNNVYASTRSGSGEAHLYQFNGSLWAPKPVPGYHIGFLHTMAGVRGDFYFRVDRVLMRDRSDGLGLQPVFEEPGEHMPVRGLVYLGPGHLMMLETDGVAFYHEGVWSDRMATPFAEVEDAWGVRDGNGDLQVFALGASGADDGMRVWRFQEENPVTHEGSWLCVLADPAAGGAPGCGCGKHIWGTAGNDVYATAMIDGEAHLFRHDQLVWTQLVPPTPVGAVHGVWGTGEGQVWFSTSGGHVVRYQRPNSPPDIANAAASVARLWPPDGRLVPVSINGIADRDGDAVTIAITGVNQDEDVVTIGDHAACPDAMVSGGIVQLRAEHAEGGDGRTYEIQYTATDQLGATSTGTVHVCAPHYISAPCHFDPAVFDSRGACAAPVTESTVLDAVQVAGVLKVRYELTEPARVDIGIYDLAGRRCATVDDQFRDSGVHEVTWAQRNLHSGVYFVKLNRGGSAAVRRVVLIR